MKKWIALYAIRWCGKQDLNSMSLSNCIIYCAMQFCEARYMVFLYRPVQRSKAVSEAVKGILKGSFRQLL